MDIGEARRRAAAVPVARLGTIGSGGWPHLVPCCFALAGDTVYSAVDGKPKRSLALQRLANVAADERATLLVDHYDDDWSTLWWVRAEGRGRTLGTDGDERGRALDLLAAKYHQYRERPPPGPVLAIEVVNWRWWEAAPR